MADWIDQNLRERVERRRLVGWRIAAVVLFVFALAATFGREAQTGTSFAMRSAAKKPHIARLMIKGVISNDVGRVTAAIDDARKSSSVTGLLLVVDSPGGGVTGGERLHDAIMRFAATKPVVVSMGDMGASAAYMLSVPAQHIVARSSTLTGSIGVIMQRPDVSTLLTRWGVSMDAIISGPMKDQTDPTSPLTSDGRAMLQGLVDDLFEQFVQMVAAGRHMPVEKVKQLADGRPYTGHQALALGLVDEIGDEADALSWLRKRLKVGAEYPVLPLMRPSDASKTSWYDILLHRKRSSVLTWLLGGQIEGRLAEQTTSLWLDGPVSILQL